MAGKLIFYLVRKILDPDSGLRSGRRSVEEELVVRTVGRKLCHSNNRFSLSKENLTRIR